MKYIQSCLFFQASIAAANDNDHPCIRRVQSQLLPQCGIPPCWCDLNASSSTSTVCPDYPADKIYASETDVATFFATLELANPDYNGLQLCYPDLSTSVNLEGVSLDPNILCDEGILVKDKKSKGKGKGKASKAKSSKASSQCMRKCKQHKGNEVCGIQFMRDGAIISPDEYSTSCASSNVANSYKVRTFKNDVKGYGYFPFHDGACGVCSTTQDMASFLRHSFAAPTIDTMSFLCQMTVTKKYPNITPKEFVDQVSLCLQHGIQDKVPPAHLTETCAYTWAINIFLTGLPEDKGGCNALCLDMLGLLLNNDCTPQNNCPYNVTDCSLHDCLLCDDSVSGKQFIELSGNTRRYAGIHTLLPRLCGALANISHTCVAQDYAR